MKNKLLKILNSYIEKESDINEHLSTLVNYGSKCKHITEFGVRVGLSTTAFLNSKAKTVVSYDIQMHEKFNYKLLRKLAKEIYQTDYKFIEKSTLDIEIDETDLLFIDTLHTYTQLKQELNLHHNKVTNFIVLHDIVSFGQVSEDDTEPGLFRAMIEFLNENHNWIIEDYFVHNNGLVILKNTKGKDYENC